MTRSTEEAMIAWASVKPARSRLSLAGAVLDDLTPLTWAIEEGSGLTLTNVDEDTGTADFTAADVDRRGDVVANRQSR